MNFIGIDLHKKTVSLCVVNQEREILDRRRFYCSEPERIVGFFETIKPFQAVMPLAARCQCCCDVNVTLAHLGKDV